MTQRHLLLLISDSNSLMCRVGPEAVELARSVSWQDGTHNASFSLIWFNLWTYPSICLSVLLGSTRLSCVLAMMPLIWGHFCV